MAATMEVILTALALLREAFAALHKDQLEKFEDEWRKDESEFLEARQKGDYRRLAELISKYSTRL